MVSHDQTQIVQTLLTSESTLEAAAAAAGLTPDSARELIDAYLQERADLGPEVVNTGVGMGAEIVRDSRGVPHISADNPADLYFALGYAQAQDRLWQLDYLRRQAHGRLSEIFGAETLQSDILSKTLDMTGVAKRSFASLNDESRLAVDSFAAGINGWIAATSDRLPIEFELLGYQPEPWDPIDSIAVLKRWWWYLTGRLGVLTTPEVLRVALKSDARYAAFFAPDAPVAIIVPEGNYDPSNPWPSQPMDPASTGFGVGSYPGNSNNWVTAPSISDGDNALLASDPHVYFTVPADWYEVHLRGAGMDVSGASYPAVPGVLIGRNRDVAWGLTNNICSLRDLYLEEFNPENPTEYRSGDSWIAVDERIDEIVVKGAETHRHVTRTAHGRPIVDHLIPPAALPANLWGGEQFGSSSLSLAWVGFEESDEPQCLINVARSTNVREAREAFREWRCPTFNMVLADGEGNIGYQSTGAIPLRGREKRGYRSANDSVDAWQGTIPFDGLPRVDNPARGWIASANNKTAPDDFPYPLSGTWAPEDRAPRAEHLLETLQPHSLEGFLGMQLDIHSGRAERGTPGLLAATANANDDRTIAARGILNAWDFEMSTDSAGPTLYYVFLWRWHQHVVSARVTDELKPLVIDAGWGLSADLLHANVADWFGSDEIRVAEIEIAFSEAIDWLADRFGGNVDEWKWGRLHRLGAVHPAARTPLQHELLDIPPRAHNGGASTLAAAYHVPAGAFDTRLGANYRFAADLGSSTVSRAVCWPGQSGNPGSPHYRDQVDAHLTGQFGTISLDWEEISANAEHRIRLFPLT